MIRNLLALFVCVAILHGYSSGPPDSKTGRPGEGTCLDCHSGGTGPSDSAFITGLGGPTYTPGQTYSLTLHVSYAGQLRWGFELTTTVVNSGSYAGQLIVTDAANTQLSASGGRDYLKQTSVGSRAGQPDSATWTFQWLAPAAGTGPVMFYWCSNAANNNGASSGDIIIRDSLYLTEASGIAEGGTANGRRLWRYTNPSRKHTVITYEGDPHRPVRIYATSGRLVRTLTPEPAAELLRVTWDGRDADGRRVPEATYFVRLGAEVTSVARVQLVN